MAGRVYTLRRNAGEDQDVPTEVRSRLVASLFERRDSIVNGGVAGILVGAIVAFTDAGTWAIWWLAAHTVLFVARVVHLTRFNRRAQPDPLVEAPRFAIGGIASALLWGLLGGLSLLLLDDAVLQLAVVITASGVAGGTASRNAGHPALAKVQVAATLIPTALGALARGEPLYLFVAMLCLLHVHSLVSLVTRLYADALTLLLTSRERAMMAEALARQNERFEAALDNMSHGLCMFDSEHRVIVHNRRYLELFGHSDDAVTPGTSLRDLFARATEGTDRDPEEVFSFVRAELATQGRAELEHDLGESTLAITYNALPSGGTVAVYADVTERRRNEAHLSFLARHDTLTGLPNRRQFTDAVEQALSGDAEGVEATAVFCLDLDRFKAVNDTLGHPAGDSLLCMVAARLRDEVGNEGLLARFGGDEFAVLAERMSQPAASALAERILAALSRPYVLDGQQAVIGASIGIAFAAAGGSDQDTLIKNADLALYRSKADGKGTWRFFDPIMGIEAHCRRLLEIDLREAFANGDLELHYQPCVDLASGRAIACEALLRWRHPSRGLIYPESFIGLAEEVGLMVPIGEWVLRQACAQAMCWPEPLRVAVNVSAVQFRAHTLVPAVVSALATSGLPAERLELEITETALIEDEVATLRALKQLRELGVRIAMDDFGTGYSSLSYLRSFPFDRIKIDQSFVGEVAAAAECLAIVKAVAGLGSSLGIAVTAEGVEMEDQLDSVRAAGCAEAQGYLISLPLDTCELNRYLAKGGQRLTCAV